MLALVVFIGSAVAAILLLLGSGSVFSAETLQRENYVGRTIPTGAGILFVPVYLLAYVAARMTDTLAGRQAYGPAESLLILVVGMCFLGLLDDLLGDKSSSGFKGHFTELFKGTVTTGMLKAVGGLLVAMAASLPLSGPLWELFLNAFLIALTANLFNLLDMRPGRALKVFIPVFAGLLALNWSLSDIFLPYFLAVGATALVLLPGDLRERFMLGDAGSNVLGATLGLGIVVGANSWWKLGILVFVLLLTSRRK